MNNGRKFISLLFLVVFFSGCASTQIVNMEDANKFQHVEDEKSLWQTVEKMQENLLNSSAIYPDDRLHAYVNRILDKLTEGKESAWGVDVTAHILFDSDFNAGMYPNGFMVINTGLLANIDNEAQLAMLLGHELTHFLHRHCLKQINNRVNITAALSVFQVAAVGASYGLAYSGYDTSALCLVHDTVALGMQGMYYGYSRTCENDADSNGFELMKRAGYDPREAKKMFEHMMKSQELIEKKHQMPYFYSSHPKTKQRISHFEKYFKGLSPAEIEGVSKFNGETEYRGITQNLILDNLELDIRKNNLKLAKHQLEKYARLFPENPRSLYLDALILLEDGNQDAAIDKLVQSKAYDTNNPEVLRVLALQLYKRGEKEKARVDFQRYLQLKPDANDAEFIRGYLNEK